MDPPRANCSAISGCCLCRRIQPLHLRIGGEFLRPPPRNNEPHHPRTTAETVVNQYVEAEGRLPAFAHIIKLHQKI
jgi:hypothetical protein